MTVDSFKFLPRIIAEFYKMTERSPQLPIPWTALDSPVATTKVGLVTSGGLYLRGSQPPFDTEREQSEPTWGDPSYRAIPTSTGLGDIAVSHLHLNTADIEQDFNILLPIHRLMDLVMEGVVGGSAEEHYAFMGYQGYPPDSSRWEQEYGPQVARSFLDQGVSAVILTPA